MVENDSFTVERSSLTVNSRLLTPESISANFILQAHTLTYQGKQFFFDVEGSLDLKIKPILFLNGAFQDRKSWKKFVNHFKGDTLCITVDLPGMGEADTIDEHTLFDYQAECINEMLRYLGLTKVNLISASYGTPIAIKFAQMYPQRINKNIITGPLSEIPLYARSAILKSLKYLNANEMKAFASNMITTLINLQKKTEIDKQKLAHRMLGNLSHLTEKGKRHYFVASIRLLTQSVYSKKNSIEKKTLIFTGEFDHFTTPEYCLNIAKLFNDVQFVTIKRADHMYHLERTDVVLFALDCFFDNRVYDLIDNNDFNYYNLTRRE